MNKYKIKESEQMLLEDGAAALSRYRGIKGITQTELGSRVGVGKARICKIESGKNTSVDTLNTSYAALGMTLNVSVEPDLSSEEKVFLAYDLVDQIAHYAKSNDIGEHEAYKRLDREGRIEKFILNYDIFKDNVI